MRRIYRGVLVDDALPDTLQLRSAAALLALPSGSVLSHRTAAELRNLPLPKAEGDLVHAYVPGPAEPCIAGIRVHRCRDPLAVEEVRGLPLTTLARTWCDLAGELDREHLAILGDAILHTKRTTPAQLEAELKLVRRGRRLGQEVLPFLDPRADSPMETRTRLVMIDGGLPRPVVNRPVFDSAGGWIACPDLQYPRFRVAIEYEGEHHLTRDQQRSDIRRDEAYRDEGWILIKVTYEDVMYRPATLVERIRRALQAQGYPG